MMAWEEEAGENWDTKIAEHFLMAWIGKAVAMAPDAELGILANIGDFLHWDGLEAVTPTSGHILDADTRYQRIVEVAIRCVCCAIIKALLEKHNRVHVLMCDANHDPAGAVWLREWIPVMFADNPRVTVDRNADSYYCLEHGQTSLFFHHGHKRKVTNVDDVFVAKFREVFGRTKFSYAHLGHLHQKQVLETNLMVVEQHRTLAARDAYAAKGGWMSGREAQVITYHTEFGEVSRFCINPEMLR